MRAGVALGSNLGDRLTNLRNARSEIERLGAVQAPVLASAIYETEPVGCEAGAAKFLNAAIEFEYAGAARDLWRELVAIEKSFGRPEQHAKNISRTIDLDLLYFGDAESSTSGLQLPHPRMQSRKFVLAPLADIRADLILPNQTRSVGELLASLDEPGTVVRLTSDWKSR